MTRLRGAVIGCGMISQFHLRAWQRIPAVEIACLCDPQIERAERLSQNYASVARIYSTAEELLATETVDFVDILSPPNLHKEHCLLARDAGAHVICQKPLCVELSDAIELVDAFRDAGKQLCVHDNHRDRPWFRRIRELQKSGFFGVIKYVRLEQHDPQEPAEEFKLHSSRGIMLEYGVHLVDMMRALLGEPRRVAASFANVNPRVQGESLAVATYDYDGAVAVIDIAWKPAPPAHGCLIVEGARGTALYEGTMARGQSARFRVYQEGQPVVDEMRSPMDDYAESFYLLQRQFTDCMLGFASSPQPATENLHTLRATIAAYDAARTRQIILT
jgi:predicted dehydrogenase